MFSLLYGLWESLFSRPNVHILIIGLDHAGKTTLMERLKSEFTKKNGLPPQKINPTIGMNLAKIKYGGSQVIFWDLGGQLKMRSMWERYYSEAHAVIFVIDSADVSRFEEAKLAHDAVCRHEGLTHVPVVIFANKQDLPSSLSLSDVAMTFENAAAVGPTKIFPVSSITGAGVRDALATTIEIGRQNRITMTM
jgi:ADP-ribosylation factor related protein 1